MNKSASPQGQRFFVSYVTVARGYACKNEIISAAVEEA